MKLIAIIGLGLALAACQTASPTAKTTDAAAMPDEQAFKLARAKLLDQMKDPESAKVDPTMVRKTAKGNLLEPVPIVCGRVNGKNAYGAYTGMKAFVYKIEADTLLIDGEDSARGAYGPIATMWCS